MLHTLNAENPSRAIAYVRVSSQRQVDEAVRIQREIGIPIDQWYIDNGY